MISCSDEKEEKPSDEVACSETCQADEICIVASENEAAKCAKKCSEVGANYTCSESEGSKAVMTMNYKCDYAADGKTLIQFSQVGSYLCETEKCNADKTDCAENNNNNNEEKLCSGVKCADDEVCIAPSKVDAEACYKTCEKAETREKCEMANEIASAHIVYSCNYAADDKTLILKVADGVTEPDLSAHLCEYPMCNEAGDACATADEYSDSLCIAPDGLSICEDDYVCRLVKVEDGIEPYCVSKDDEGCETVGETISNCDDGTGVTKLTCLAGALKDEGKNYYYFDAFEPCGVNEGCQMVDGAAKCQEQFVSDPEESCGAEFTAACNADGTTTSCINGKVVEGAASTSGTCHVFADAQVAMYILESSCTLLEMPKEVCFESGGIASYTKQTCGKAEDNNYYWYMSDAEFCTDGCNDDGKTCK